MRSKSNYTVDGFENNRPMSSFTKGNTVNNDHLLKRESGKFNQKQEASGYFVKCIETIKKEITRRKDMPSLNFYKDGNPISYEQFSRFDCMKLMELALSNKNVLEGFYQLLITQKE